MKYIFHPEALKEYEESALYYKRISIDLAISFVNCVEIGIQKIIENPKAWSIIKEDVRRHLIKRFPFGIYYTLENDGIIILAIMHMSRKPGYWISRMRKDNKV
ncbi:MAG: type II toxin-antitoxin system RelE/ParE family toxin [Candidatus Omnitrophota bacterium]